MWLQYDHAMQNREQAACSGSDAFAHIRIDGGEHLWRLPKQLPKDQLRVAHPSLLAAFQCLAASPYMPQPVSACQVLTIPDAIIRRLLHSFSCMRVKSAAFLHPGNRKHLNAQELLPIQQAAAPHSACMSRLTLNPFARLSSQTTQAPPTAALRGRAGASEWRAYWSRMACTYERALASPARSSSSLLPLGAGATPRSASQAPRCASAVRSDVEMTSCGAPCGARGRVKSEATPNSRCLHSARHSAGQDAEGPPAASRAGARQACQAACTELRSRSPTCAHPVRCGTHTTCRSARQSRAVPILSVAQALQQGALSEGRLLL